MNRILIASLLVSIASSTVRADEGFIIGATTSSGVIYSDKDHEAIVMNREIIDFKGFLQTYTTEFKPAAIATYNVLFEFENTLGNYYQVDCGFPIQVNFTHFDAASRPSIIEFLTTVFPDDFSMTGSAQDIIGKLQETFRERIFIRRFINVQQLYLLQIGMEIIQDGKAVPIDKVMAEFRLVDDDRGHKKSVLSMQLHLLHKLNFTPRQKSTVIVRYYTPAFNMGHDGYNFYAPYILGTGATWKDDIQAIYVLNRPQESSLAIPYYMDFKSADFDYDKRLTIVKEHEPESFEKIGFFAVRNSNCGCSRNAGLQEALTLPWSLKNITASSTLSATSLIQGACFETVVGTSVVRWIPDFDMGYNQNLTVVNEIVESDSSNARQYRTIAENQCSGDEAIVELKKAYHPLWAFDIGPDTLSFQGIGQAGHFSERTAWCEGARGKGEGQYLEFEITQPVDAIMLYPGNQKGTEVYKASSRPKVVDLVEVTTGRKIRTLPFWDFMTSSSFDMKTESQERLEPGRYRIVVKETYAGTSNEDLCISGVYFRFAIDDPWLGENYMQLTAPPTLIGMSRQQVIDLLGNPIESTMTRDVLGAYEVLRYQDLSVYVRDGIVETVAASK
jgi:hypothetical protein